MYLKIHKYKEISSISLKEQLRYSYITYHYVICIMGIPVYWYTYTCCIQQVLYFSYQREIYKEKGTFSFIRQHSYSLLCLYLGQLIACYLADYLIFDQQYLIPSSAWHTQTIHAACYYMLVLDQYSTLSDQYILILQTNAYTGINFKLIALSNQ